MEITVSQCASSALRPAYMTISRSAISATPQLSWVIMIQRVPSARRRSRNRSKLSALARYIEAAGRRPSAIRIGRAGQRDGIITRWR